MSAEILNYLNVQLINFKKLSNFINTEKKSNLFYAKIFINR